MRETRSDRRRKKRQGRRRSAWIGFDDRPGLMLCVLWDLSETGARVAPTHGEVLPDLFTLYLTRDGGERRSCRVAWRNGRYLGVEFIDPSEAELLSYTLAQRRHSMRSPYSPFRKQA